MLRKYKTLWKDHINKVIHYYNYRKHTSTGFSSHYIMFDWKPRLPIDITLQTKGDLSYGIYKQKSENWKEVMEDLHVVSNTLQFS